MNYTNEQIEDAVMRLITRGATYEPDVIADILRSILTERQAGSSGDVPYCAHSWERHYSGTGRWVWECSECFKQSGECEYASKNPDLATNAYNHGYRAGRLAKPPQPPTKESVRGVQNPLGISDAEMDRCESILTACVCLPDFKERDMVDPQCAACDIGSEVIDTFQEMRAALQLFANRGDGDE